MTPAPARRRRRRWPWIAAGLVALLLVLMLDIAPVMPPRAAPTAVEVRAGRDAAQRLRAALQSPPPVARARFDATDVAGVAALVADGARLRRLDAGLVGNRVAGAASFDLPLGLWLNVRGAVASRPDGFPPVSVRLGRLPVPHVLVRLGGEVARLLLNARGAALPPLDKLVRSLAIERGRILLTVQSPVGGSGLVRGLVAFRAAPTDPALTARIYCRLAAAPRDRDLAVHVRRAFAAADGDPAANRAALVALAMLVVGERAGDLADTAKFDARRCLIEPPRIELLDRPDLAKHWALSAALGATLGEDATRALGEWKELSDSLPGGSGFSFVDLAADRAGLRVGRAASDPGRADETAAALARANTFGLLPLDAAVLDEGLGNDAFVARYGAIDGADYSRAVAQIDRLLDTLPLLAE